MPHFSKRFKIEAKSLSNLYWEKGLSLLEIGKKLHLSPRTVNIRMKECGIPLRSPGVPTLSITKKELRKLYMVQKLSSRKIAKFYGCAYSTIDYKIHKFGFPLRTLAAAHITTKRISFSGNLKEKAYLLGFRIGDLRVRKIYKNSETINIDCGSTKPEQINLIKNLFTKYGGIWIGRPQGGGKVQIECRVNKTFLFLLRKYKEFPKWATAKRTTFLSILAGFIDAEGSFYVSSDKKSASFSIGNYNTRILRQIQNFLIKEKIRNRLFLGAKKGYTGKDGYAHNADYWILTIYSKAELVYFIKIIRPYLKHKDKLKESLMVLDNIATRNKKYGYIGMKMIKFRHGREIFNNHANILR